MTVSREAGCKPDCLRERARYRRGFTLFEVLVAILLILGIAAGGFGLFWQVVAAKTRLSQMQTRASGREALSRELERAMASCFVGGKVGVFRGDGSSVQIPCRELRLGGSGDGAMSLAKWSAGQLVALKLDAAGSRVVAKLTGGASDDEREMAIVNDVASMRLRYLTEVGWVDTFDANETGTLPRALEVALWWKEEGAATVPAGDFGDGEELMTSPADELLVLAVPDGPQGTPPDGVSGLGPATGTTRALAGGAP